MPGYVLQQAPTRIPVPGDKLIEEHIGRVATQTAEISIAHMVAPPGWAEPAQTPQFDEFTLLVAGRFLAVVDGEKVLLYAGQSLWVKPGSTVTYSNPFDEPAEYWAVCTPAFSVETAGREGS